MSTRKAIDRLIDLALGLTNAGRVGLTTPEIMRRVGYQSDEAGKRALIRDLDDLREIGLEIDNAAHAGEDARYVLRPGDVRLRLEFTPEQRTALMAALATGRDTVRVDETPLPVDLNRVQEAVRSRCLLTFHYNGTRRILDPYSYRWFRRDVLVLGRDRGDGLVKSFSVSRMLDLEISAPGSAEIPPDAVAPSLDPVTWRVDPPVEAQLTCPGFTDDVRALLGGTVEGDVVTVMVTNRLVFFARLFELGSRARLDGPPELRADLRARLEVAL